MNFSNPNLFIRKRGYQYFYIDGNPNPILNYIISYFSYISCDIQKYCNEIDNSSGVACSFYRTYFGFSTPEDLETGFYFIFYNFCINSDVINIKIYKEGKAYIDVTYPEVSYLFYDDL